MHPITHLEAAKCVRILIKLRESTERPISYVKDIFDSVLSRERLLSILRDDDKIEVVKGADQYYTACCLPFLVAYIVPAFGLCYSNKRGGWGGWEAQFDGCISLLEESELFRTLYAGIVALETQKDQRKRKRRGANEEENDSSPKRQKRQKDIYKEKEDKGNEDTNDKGKEDKSTMEDGDGPGKDEREEEPEGVALRIFCHDPYKNTLGDLVTSFFRDHVVPKRLRPTREDHIRISNGNFMVRVQRFPGLKKKEWYVVDHNFLHSRFVHYDVDPKDPYSAMDTVAKMIKKSDGVERLFA